MNDTESHPFRSNFTAVHPAITVIVPVRNEERDLPATLDSLAEQDYPRECYEVLVVDGDSTDATRTIVEHYAARYPHVRLLRNPNRLASAARNIGVVHARGDLITIVDGHCLVGSDYIQKVADAFARGDIDCLGRPQPLEAERATPLQSAIGAARASRLGHHPASYIYSEQERIVPAASVAVAYRREVFERIGLFDERFDACEDVDFNHRVDREGMRCLLAPSIAVRYAPRASLRGLFRQLSRYGRGRVRLLRKHSETFSLPSLAPAMFVAGAICGAPLAGLNGWLAGAYVGILALYAFVVLAFSLAVARRERSWRMLWWLPAVFPAIHFGAGWGSLSELLVGRRIEPIVSPGLAPRPLAATNVASAVAEPDEVLSS